MDSAEPPRLRCPDCGKAVGPLVGQPSCEGCGRRFVAEGGVWDLLPASRETVKINEDQAHVEAGLPTWRRVFMHKRYWLGGGGTGLAPPIPHHPPPGLVGAGGGGRLARALGQAKAPRGDRD